jgi:hypothetical protein
LEGGVLLLEGSDDSVEKDESETSGRRFTGRVEGGPTTFPEEDSEGFTESWGEMEDDEEPASWTSLLAADNPCRVVSGEERVSFPRSRDF